MLFTNQKGRAPYRLRRGLLDPCNQRGRARYRLRGAVLHHCNQIKGWVRDIVCAGGCCTAAIKEGVREIVCTGGCYRPLQSKGACAISSARGAAGSLQSNQRGMRDIVCAGGCWTAAITGGVGEIAVNRKKWQQIGLGLAPAAVARCCSIRFFYLSVGFRVPGLTLFARCKFSCSLSQVENGGLSSS